MRHATRVAAVWGVCAAASLMVPVCTAAVLVWRAGEHLEDRRQEVEEELRRCSERSAALPPFDWEPYRELVRAARENPARLHAELGPASLARDVRDSEGWKARGCPLGTAVAATDVDFFNRHWPVVFGKIRVGPVRQALLQTAAAQEAFRGGGLWSALERASLERWAHCGWHAMLEGGALARAELEDLAGLLDRLEAARRPLADELEVEYLLRSRMVLEIYRTGKDREGVLETQAPGWRSLWSRRVYFSRVLRRLERQRNLMVALASGPGSELWRQKDEVARDLSPCSPLFGCVDQAVLQFEGESMLRRRLLRTAVAAAQYAAEEGRPPSGVVDLVPRFLPSLPRCPLTGTPLSCSGEGISGDVEDRLSAWPISRRHSGASAED